MDRPLVHIGYHKTGTNWLQHVWWGEPASGYRCVGGNKREHPVRRFVLDRPLDFDADSLRRDLDQILVPIHEEGLLPVVSLERLSGHYVSGGHDAKEIADRIHEVLPDARILIVIREQKSIIVSSYKQYVKAGGILPVERFLDPPTTRSARVPAFDFRHFEYDRLIAYYHELFGKENVLALCYEQFQRDGRAFVETVARFAGRPVPEAVLARLPYTKAQNAAPSALAIAAVRRLNRFAPPRELNAAPVLGFGRALRAAQRVKEGGIPLPRLTRALDARTEQRLRKTVAKAVGKRYVESNRRTAELTGIDVGALGWPV